MAKVDVFCPVCGTHEHVVRNGKSPQGEQRYYCRSCRKTFMLNYLNQGCRPDTATKIVEMTLNGSGVRDIARVLNVSTTTVCKTLKKNNAADLHR